MIHPQAVVGDDVTIGEGSRVWQFASVIRGAVLGADCNIASCAIVDGARLGDGCLVGHGASLHPGCRLGNGVFVGPGAGICNDAWPRVDKAGFDIEALKADFVTVVVEDGASIGMGAIILPGVVVGAGAMVAAGAVVSRSVPVACLWRRDGTVTPTDMLGPRKRMRLAC